MGRDLTRLKKVAERARALDPLSSTFITDVAELKRAAEIALNDEDTGFGNPISLERARAVSAANRKAAADKRNEAIREVIAELRALGKHSFREIGEGLTARGIHPPKAAKWRPSLVRAIEMGGNDNGKN